jgi:CRP-like cAMP-binding protein
MDWSSILSAPSFLPKSSLVTLMELGNEIHCPKGHLLFREGVVEPYFYFIGQGLVRAFTDLPDQSITFYFGREGDVVLSMRSYVSGLSSYEQVELLEPSILLQFPVKKVLSLYDNDIQLANWGRKLAENELLRTEERLISRQVKSASERYQELISQHPDLIKRVALGHIASYLGITQVSLSRIRALSR